MNEILGTVAGRAQLRAQAAGMHPAPNGALRNAEQIRRVGQRIPFMIAHHSSRRPRSPVAPVASGRLPAAPKLRDYAKTCENCTPRRLRVSESCGERAKSITRAGSAPITLD